MTGEICGPQESISLTVTNLSYEMNECMNNVEKKNPSNHVVIGHRWLPIDGCIELTGGVPEKVRNLPSMLAAEDNGKAADRLFFDLVRASQLGNIILVQAPHHVHKGDKHNKLRLAEAAQLGKFIIKEVKTPTLVLKTFSK